MDENKPADLKRRDMRRRQGGGLAEAQVVQLFPPARVHAGADVAPDLPETARKEKPTLRQRLLQAIFKAVDTDNW